MDCGAIASLEVHRDEDIHQLCQRRLSDGIEFLSGANESRIEPMLDKKHDILPSENWKYKIEDRMNKRDFIPLFSRNSINITESLYVVI
jgi:hypothetical protein